jgi:pteridine reductase
VTGGGRRLGACTVRALHHAGMRVVVHYRSSGEDAAALCAELNATRPESARPLFCDLDRTSSIPSFIERAVALHGRLDALVNNASTFYPTPIGSVTEAAWDELLGSNLKAPFFIAQSAAPHLARTRGSIVNITDIYATRPLAHHPVYSIAKAGLRMLTEALATELGPEIRVNAVAPGAILWPDGEAEGPQHRAVIARTPLKRRGDPQDIARAVLFLVRDASFTTGATITVDGGRSVRAN